MPRTILVRPMRCQIKVRTSVENLNLVFVVPISTSAGNLCGLTMRNFPDCGFCSLVAQAQLGLFGQRASVPHIVFSFEIGRKSPPRAIDFASTLIRPDVFYPQLILPTRICCPDSVYCQPCPWTNQRYFLRYGWACQVIRHLRWHCLHMQILC